MSACLNQPGLRAFAREALMRMNGLLPRIFIGAVKVKVGIALSTRCNCRKQRKPFPRGANRPLCAQSKEQLVRKRAEQETGERIHTGGKTCRIENRFDSV